MKRTMLVIAFAFLAAAAYAQSSDAVIQTYERNFARSSIGTKLELLQEAAGIEGVNMGPVFDMAIAFVLDNAELLKTDSIMRDIAIFSVQMVGKYKYAPSVDNLWKLFMAYRESMVRIPVLSVLGDVGAGNVAVVANINLYLSNQNSIFRAGTLPDLATLDASVVALGRLGDGSSFPALFSAMNMGYSDIITKHAEEALSLLKGDYRGYLIDVIQKSQPSEKLAALKVALANARFADADRGEICIAALESGLLYSGPDAKEIAAARELRYAAADALVALKWSKASTLAVKHFYQVLSDYGRSIASKVQLAGAIDCLGAMGTSDAAQALALYLGLVNAQTEQGKGYDADIVVAVIRNLGILGDKSAFDYLLYVGYLNYSDSVKKLAKDALGRLKW